MALEQLTPHLSRQAYKQGYMQFLRDEQANEAMNLGANIQYQNTGESLQSIQNMSGTLSGLSRETMMSVLTLRLSGYVQDVRGTLTQLPPNQLNFVYLATDLIKEEIKSNFGGDLGQRGGIPAGVFKAMVSGLYTGSNPKARTSTYIPPSTDTQGQVPDGNQSSSFNSAEVPRSSNSRMAENFP